MPKSDLPLKLGLGAAAAIILILIVALMVSLFPSDSPDGPSDDHELLEPLE